MTAQPRSSFDNTKIALLILAFIVLAFTYDHAVSDVMYALGYDRNKISNFWFLRNQYGYLNDVKHAAGLTPDTFHVFELFVWAMIPLNLARIAKGIFSWDMRTMFGRRGTRIYPAEHTCFFYLCLV